MDLGSDAKHHFSPATTGPPDTNRPGRPDGIGRWPAPWLAGLMVGLVVVLAAAVRLPYCQESFWLDELHTAWTVWDSPAEVAARAAAGNQTAPYYWGLWGWRQLAGDSERALRLSSVLLVSLACGLLTLAPPLLLRHRTATGWLSGSLAGLLLAFDPHAIFFGTELRVFPLTILLAAAACATWCGWLVRRERRWAWATWLIVAIAGLAQPTSFSVLGWIALATLPAALGGWRNAGWLTLTVLLAAAAGWYLTGDVLQTAWRHRSQWASVGSGQSLTQAIGLWHWTPLLIVPAMVAVAAAAAARLLPRSVAAEPEFESEFESGAGAVAARRWWEPCGPAAAGCVMAVWLYPLLVVLLATAVVWLLAATGIVPLLHRRYLVACLPLLAWSAGLASGQLYSQAMCLAQDTGEKSPPATSDRSICRTIQRPLAVAIVLAITACLAIDRPGTVAELIRQQPRAMRGENWRGAVAAIHLAQPPPVGDVWLDAGLIEAPRMLARGDHDDWQYLQFPLRGPYALPRVRPFVRGDAEAAASLAVAIRAGQADTAILRCSAAAAQRWADQLVLAAGSDSLRYHQRSFGGVQWLRFCETAAAGSAADR